MITREQYRQFIGPRIVEALRSAGLESSRENVEAVIDMAFDDALNEEWTRASEAEHGNCGDLRVLVEWLRRRVAN